MTNTTKTAAKFTHPHKRAVKAAARNTKNIALSEAFSRYAADAIEQGASDETRVALDAAIVGAKDAHKLLVGVPVAWAIGSDRYADKIAKITPSLLTMTLESGKVFRFDGEYFTMARHRFISTLGVGEDYRDPCF